MANEKKVINKGVSKSNIPEGSQTIKQEKQKAQGKDKDLEKGSDRIFDGGPTKSKIEDWKNKYGNIYMTEYEDERFIWRTLSRIEFKKLINSQGEMTEWSREERVCEQCVIWPEDYNNEKILNGKAGTPAVLAEEIMAKSGFVPRTGSEKL